MNHFEITKLPVVIVAEPRSGSDAFAEHLASLNPDLKLFIEPNFTGTYRDAAMPALNEFVEYSNNNDKFIMKVICYNTRYGLPIATQNLIHSDKPFIITTHRRNQLEQTVSWYIARMRNTWRYFDSNSVTDAIELDDDILNLAVKAIAEAKDNISKFKSDASVYYEDLINLNSSRHITPKPSNYYAITNLLQHKLENFYARVKAEKQ